VTDEEAASADESSVRAPMAREELTISVGVCMAGRGKDLGGRRAGVSDGDDERESMIVTRTRHVDGDDGYVGRPLMLLSVYDVAGVCGVQGEALGTGWRCPYSRSMYGSAIGIIVACRNQSEYARGWEARKRWAVGELTRGAGNAR